MNKKEALGLSFENSQTLFTHDVSDCVEKVKTILEIDKNEVNEDISLFCRAKENNIISQNAQDFFTDSNNTDLSYVEFLKIALKSNGFVDSNNCAFRNDSQWYAPFLYIALSHNLVDTIPNEGQLFLPISRDKALEILKKIEALQQQTKNSSVLNICPFNTVVTTKFANFRSDAGNFSTNSFSHIPDNSSVIALGNPVIGKTILYNQKNENLWQGILYDGKIGFVLTRLLDTNDTSVMFQEKIQRDFDIFEKEGEIQIPCENIFLQEIKKYRVKGEDTSFLGGYLVYESEKNTVQFIRSEFFDFYKSNGGACSEIGYPIAPSSHFGNSSQKPMGWSQAFSSGKTIYTPHESENFYFFQTNRSNCVFTLSQSQVCCESPRGKMCHGAVSGGGYIYNNHSRTNNSEWEWHQSEEGNIVEDIAGPLPRGEYEIEYKEKSCAFTQPYIDWSCISYLLYKDGSSSLSPAIQIKNPDGSLGDIRENIFFTPSFYTNGSIAFSEYLPNGNANNWEEQSPQWKKLTDILDTPHNIEEGEQKFLGKMIVTP